jgi:hypothetical protein
MLGLQTHQWLEPSSPSSNPLLPVLPVTKDPSLQIRQLLEPFSPSSHPLLPVPPAIKDPSLQTQQFPVNCSSPPRPAPIHRSRKKSVLHGRCVRKTFCGVSWAAPQFQRGGCPGVSSCDGVCLSPPRGCGRVQWFFKLIKSIRLEDDSLFEGILNSAATVIFSDRQNGLGKAVRLQFPLALHLPRQLLVRSSHFSFCMLLPFNRHITTTFATCTAHTMCSPGIHMHITLW